MCASAISAAQVRLLTQEGALIVSVRHKQVEHVTRMQALVCTGACLLGHLASCCCATSGRLDAQMMSEQGSQAGSLSAVTPRDRADLLSSSAFL
jgi:hypothetical protein